MCRITMTGKLKNRYSRLCVKRRELGYVQTLAFGTPCVTIYACLNLPTSYFIVQVSINRLWTEDQSYHRTITFLRTRLTSTGTMAEEIVEELNPSDLGTLEFWEKTYAQELDNFRDHRDVGEIWFGRSNALKVLRWICTNQKLIAPTDKIIDIGCGNGMMLVDLAKKGFSNLVGIDYSQKAIELATNVLKEHNVEHVNVETVDFLDSESFKLRTDFKLAHDKGTYDAISLHPDEPAEKRRKYIEIVRNILLPDGFLILTSCNWTEKEVVKHFSNDFDLLDKLPADTFQFGGQSGNTVTQLVFRRK